MIILGVLAHNIRQLFEYYHGSHAHNNGEYEKEMKLFVPKKSQTRAEFVANMEST